jgi:hypothetical protein
MKAPTLMAVARHRGTEFSTIPLQRRVTPQNSKPRRQGKMVVTRPPNIAVNSATANWLG